MKRYKINSLLTILTVILMTGSFATFAADGIKPGTLSQRQSITSHRLIVKLKYSGTTTGMSKAQIAAEPRHPLGADVLVRLQSAASVALTESHAISNGGHIIILQGSPSRATLNKAISNIRALKEVDYVEEDRIMTTQAAPNDTLYSGFLWALQPVSTAASTLNYGAAFETAWLTNSGSGVVVAVVDTGITAHADIVGSGGTVSPATGNLVSPGYDFISDCRIRGSCLASTSDLTAVRTPSADASDLGDYIDATDILSPFFAGFSIADSSWHGTHVSGTIAAIGNNSEGVIGGAYSAKILPVRVLGKGGGYASDITEGILWAAGIHSISNPNPARVINLSLGGNGACGITEQAAINAVVAAGAVMVVAAGNNNEDVANHSPANCNNVISVAAIGKDGIRAGYSNFSSPSSNKTNPVQITIAAQGADKDFDPGIWSTVNDSLTTPSASCTTTPIPSCYLSQQGTSMATPHVAAAVALMLSRKPSLLPDAVKTILTESVTPFSTSNLYPYWNCSTQKTAALAY